MIGLIGHIGESNFFLFDIAISIHLEVLVAFTDVF